MRTLWTKWCKGFAQQHEAALWTEWMCWRTILNDLFIHYVYIWSRDVVTQAWLICKNHDTIHVLFIYTVVHYWYIYVRFIYWNFECSWFSLSPEAIYYETKNDWTITWFMKLLEIVKQQINQSKFCQSESKIIQAKFIHSFSKESFFKLNFLIIL